MPAADQSEKDDTTTPTQNSGPPPATNGLSASGRYFLDSVDRVIKILDCFTPEAPELRLTDFSNQLGMPKPQVLRIVSTLEAAGYLVRNPDTKRYRLGIRLFHLGMIVRQQMDLQHVAHPYLRRLAEETQETARLVVPDDDGPICIDVVEGPRGTRVFARLGMRMPWNAGTSPKLLLAYLPDEERERILARGGFQQFTPRTVTDPDQLRREVLALRQAGYHVGFRDLDEDALGISAPIFGHDGRILGAINIAGPASRLTDPVVSGIVPAVVRAGENISRQLGYRVGLEPRSVETVTD